MRPATEPEGVGRAASQRVAICLCGAALLAGCGREGRGDAASASGAERAPIVLRVANWSGPANDSGFLALERAHREQFERAHPGVRVELEQIPGLGQFESKALLMIASGNPPDVIQLDCSSAAVFIDNGALLDLTPFIARDSTFDEAGFFENVLALTRRGDAQFAVPLDFTPMVLVYNRRLFHERGVNEPRDGWSWSEFRAAAEQLSFQRPDGARQYGVNFVNWTPFWVTWLWNNAGALVSDDGRSARIDSPAAIAALEFLADLARCKLMPTPTGAATAGVDLFRAGRAAMHVTGHWELIEYRLDQLDIGVVGLPSNLPQRQTVVYASSMAVTRAARHPELAWEFVKFQTSAEVQRARVATGVAISANRAAAAYYANDPLEQAFLRETPFARAPSGALVARYGVCEELGREMMEDILSGAATPLEAARRAAGLMNAELQR